MKTYYAVQGLYRGEWRTLFAPYKTSADAKAKLAELVETNPACKYRWIRISGHITYV